MSEKEINLAKLIEIQLESLQETKDVNSQLVLLNEVLRDAKQLSESILNREEKIA